MRVRASPAWWRAITTALMVVPLSAKAAPGRRGLLWFRAGAQAGSVWASRPIHSVRSPISAATGVKIVPGLVVKMSHWRATARHACHEPPVACAARLIAVSAAALRDSRAAGSVSWRRIGSLPTGGEGGPRRVSASGREIRQVTQSFSGDGGAGTQPGHRLAAARRAAQRWKVDRYGG